MSFFKKFFSKKKNKEDEQQEQMKHEEEPPKEEVDLDFKLSGDENDGSKKNTVKEDRNKGEEASTKLDKRDEIKPVVPLKNENKFENSTADGNTTTTTTPDSLFNLSSVNDTSKKSNTLENNRSEGNIPSTIKPFTSLEETTNPQSLHNINNNNNDDDVESVGPISTILASTKIDSTTGRTTSIVNNTNKIPTLENIDENDEYDYVRESNTHHDTVIQTNKDNSNNKDEYPTETPLSESNNNNSIKSSIKENNNSTINNASLKSSIKSETTINNNNNNSDGYSIKTSIKPKAEYIEQSSPSSSSSSYISSDNESPPIGTINRSIDNNKNKSVKDESHTTRKEIKIKQVTVKSKTNEDNENNKEEEEEIDDSISNSHKNNAASKISPPPSPSSTLYNTNNNKYEKYKSPSPAKKPFDKPFVVSPSKQSQIQSPQSPTNNNNPYSSPYSTIDNNHNHYNNNIRRSFLPNYSLPPQQQPLPMRNPYNNNNYNNPSYYSPSKLNQNLSILPSYPYLNQNKDFDDKYITSGNEYEFLQNITDIEYKKKFIEYKTNQISKLKDELSLREKKKRDKRKINNIELKRLENMMFISDYKTPKPSVSYTYTINNNTRPSYYTGSYYDCDIHKKLNNIQREVEKLNHQNANNATLNECVNDVFIENLRNEQRSKSDLSTSYLCNNSILLIDKTLNSLDLP